MASRGVDAELVDIERSICVPSDIPKAQNACIKYCFDLGADYVVYMMGDQYLTKEGDRYIKERINELGDEAHCGIPTMNIQMYSYMWKHHWQLSISTKTHIIEYNEKADGDETVGLWPRPTDRIDLLQDIGYMGTEAYYMHLKNHMHIWIPPDPHYTYKLHWIKLYERGNIDEAVQLAYQAIRKSKGIGVEPIDTTLYKELLDKMDLWSDYVFCSNIMKGYV